MATSHSLLGDIAQGSRRLARLSRVAAIRRACRGTSRFCWSLCSRCIGLRHPGAECPSASRRCRRATRAGSPCWSRRRASLRRIPASSIPATAERRFRSTASACRYRPIGTARSERSSGPHACRRTREKEFAVARGRQSPNPKARSFEWFRKNRNSKRQVVIFVHGFNNTYADAVFRFAQIVHDSGTDAAPILFTWPSRGRVFDYLYDKESANYSRRALEDLILQAAKSPDVDDVTILAHSMGGWLAAEALRGVAMREKSIPAKVKNVVLASPDIDIDVFRRQFIEMGPKRPHFAILTSTRDKALGGLRLAIGRHRPRRRIRSQTLCTCSRRTWRFRHRHERHRDERSARPQCLRRQS